MPASVWFGRFSNIVIMEVTMPHAKTASLDGPGPVERLLGWLRAGPEKTEELADLSREELRDIGENVPINDGEPRPTADQLEHTARRIRMVVENWC
jgi:hypothetical protein